MGFKIVRADHETKVRCGYKFHESDIIFDYKMALKLSGVSFFGGILAGTAGIGGSIIYSPLLLDFGLPPVVVTATAMYMVLYSSLANSFIFYIAGVIDVSYSLWLLIFVFTGSIVGLFLVNKLVMKTGRMSFIVILFTSILAVTSVVVPVYSGWEFSEQIQQGIDIWDFHPAC
jgi:uncharacterized membrane protein YfcA